MLDVVLLAKAVVVGALAAAVVMRLATWGAPRPWCRNACWTWAVAAGILAASGATDQWPHWPAREDRARFLTLLVPLALVVETLAAARPSSRATWIMRLGLAATVAPIVLHNSVYLADLNGPDSAEWSSSEAALILCGLAAILASIWAIMSRLLSRTSTSALLWVLVLDALATAVTVMLSGYFRAGLLALGLAGATAGATLASYAAQPRLPTTGSLGMSVIGIFAVVLMGRFFGALSTGLAACLLIAPLLAWTAELPGLCKLPPRGRGAAQLAFVVIPLVVVVMIAHHKFTAASTARPRPLEPSADRVHVAE